VHDADRKLRELGIGQEQGLQNRALEERIGETNDESNLSFVTLLTPANLTRSACGPGTTAGYILESGEKKVEDSLRGNEKLPSSQQYANFRNEETFPTFTGLLGDNHINLAFYDTVDGFNFMPRKH
jgi:hypothetical protein